MTLPVIWLHEEALRRTHPVFKAAPEGAEAIYIWDDDHFKQANYSLKRLVFIYETLCELPIQIIQGNTLDVFHQLMPHEIYAPATNNALLVDIVDRVARRFVVNQVQDDSYVTLENLGDCKRFFQYWNKAEKTAFMHNGGIDA